MASYILKVLFFVLLQSPCNIWKFTFLERLSPVSSLSWVPFGQLLTHLKIGKWPACQVCFRESNYTLARIWIQDLTIWNTALWPLGYIAILGFVILQPKKISFYNLPACVARQFRKGLLIGFHQKYVYHSIYISCYNDVKYNLKNLRKLTDSSRKFCRLS